MRARLREDDLKASLPSRSGRARGADRSARAGDLRRRGADCASAPCAGASFTSMLRRAARLTTRRNRRAAVRIAQEEVPGERMCSVRLIVEGELPHVGPWVTPRMRWAEAGGRVAGAGVGTSAALASAWRPAAHLTFPDAAGAAGREPPQHGRYGRRLGRRLWPSRPVLRGGGRAPRALNTRFRLLSLRRSGRDQAREADFQPCRLRPSARAMLVNPHRLNLFLPTFTRWAPGSVHLRDVHHQRERRRRL